MLFSYSVNQIYLLVRNGLMNAFLQKELSGEQGGRANVGEARPVPC